MPKTDGARRAWLCRLAAVAAGSALPAARAQDRPLRLLVGYPPGSVIDSLARLLAEKLRPLLGRAVVVENKAGAGGIIGAEALKAAMPDGSTLMLAPTAIIATMPHTHPGLRYSPIVDFAPVAHIADFQIALGIHSGIPAARLDDYAALVRKDPSKGNYASAAAGSLPHFFAVMFGRAARIEMTHVPYKGSAPALQALAGGEIAAAVVTLPDIGVVARSGKARILAVSGARRSPQYPDVPTFRESGYDIEGNGWYALYAPARTPAAEIEAIAKAAVQAVRSPDFGTRLVELGLEPTGLGPADLARIGQGDLDKWGPVIRASGFRADQ